MALGDIDIYGKFVNKTTGVLADSNQIFYKDRADEGGVISHIDVKKALDELYEKTKGIPVTPKEKFKGVIALDDLLALTDAEEDDTWSVFKSGSEDEGWSDESYTYDGKPRNAGTFFVRVDGSWVAPDEQPDFTSVVKMSEQPQTIYLPTKLDDAGSFPHLPYAHKGGIALMSLSAFTIVDGVFKPLLTRGNGSETSSWSITMPYATKIEEGGQIVYKGGALDDFDYKLVKEGIVKPDWNETDSRKYSFIQNKPTKLSQFENDADFATNSDVDKKQNKLTAGEGITIENDTISSKTRVVVVDDKSGSYEPVPATMKFFTDTKLLELTDDNGNVYPFTTKGFGFGDDFNGDFNPSNPSGQVQSDWEEDDEASGAFIKNKPTNVSAFTNDAGYLKQHQSLSDYAKKTDIPTKVSDLTNDAGYTNNNGTITEVKFNGVSVGTSGSVNINAMPLNVFKTTRDATITAEKWKEIAFATLPSNTDQGFSQVFSIYNEWGGSRLAIGTLSVSIHVYLGTSYGTTCFVDNPSLLGNVILAYDKSSHKLSIYVKHSLTSSWVLTTISNPNLFSQGANVSVDKPSGTDATTNTAPKVIVFTDVNDSRYNNETKTLTIPKDTEGIFFRGNFNSWTIEYIVAETGTFDNGHKLSITRNPNKDTFDDFSDYGNNKSPVFPSTGKMKATRGHIEGEVLPSGADVKNSAGALNERTILDMMYWKCTIDDAGTEIGCWFTRGITY